MVRDGHRRALATGAFIALVAVVIGVWSAPAAAQESIPQAVHRIDGMVRELGLQSREIDRKSREMDRKLEELDRKLKEVGRTTLDLRRRLQELEKGGGAVEAGTEVAASPAPEAVESSLGLERSEKRAVQRGLASLGYAPGRADGWFGERTREAIRRYQVALRADATGYLTAEQAKTLLAWGEEDAQRQERERQAEVPGRRFRDCEGRWCPEMVVVPAGRFMMGSPPGEEGRARNEGPVHQVTIAEPFAVGVYEVTFDEWDACRRGGGCKRNPNDAGWGRGSRPVIDVSWGDALAYVRWLSRKTGQRYRLLSESEWEYAARAGTRTPFHHGAMISTNQANYNGNYTYGSGRKGRYRNQTVPVGRFSPNAFGLHDVHGNVREWVDACWHKDYAGAPRDGRVWTSGDCTRRVLRGGSWSNGPRNVRSAVRIRFGTGYRSSNVGFRVARTSN